MPFCCLIPFLSLAGWQDVCSDYGFGGWWEPRSWCGEFDPLVTWFIIYYMFLLSFKTSFILFFTLYDDAGGQRNVWQNERCGNHGATGTCSPSATPRVRWKWIFQAEQAFQVGTYRGTIVYNVYSCYHLFRKVYNISYFVLVIFTSTGLRNWSAQESDNLGRGPADCSGFFRILCCSCSSSGLRWHGSGCISMERQWGQGLCSRCRGIVPLRFFPWSWLDDLQVRLAIANIVAVLLIGVELWEVSNLMLLFCSKLWQELGPIWPNAYWDDWLREPLRRKGRWV